MNQLSLFDSVSDRLVWLKGEIVFSLSFDQDKILRDIMRLYNQNMPFELDPTYSKGNFYKNIPQPKLKYDLNPQLPDVLPASADNLPLRDNSIGSVVFDPPFMFSLSPNVPGKIKTRFTAFSSKSEMLTLYENAMREFWRILLPKGILVFKCQDGVSQGKNHFIHYEIEKYAREIGYEQLDLFVLGSKRVLVSSTWSNQRHARKSHSFVLVFQKPQRKNNRT